MPPSNALTGHGQPGRSVCAPAGAASIVSQTASPWRAATMSTSKLRSVFAPARNNSRRRASVRPHLEALEDRLVPTAHVWRGGTDPILGTHWSVASNWSSGGSPAGDPDAVLVFQSSALRFSSVNDLGSIPIREIDLSG